jgi:sodium pump decarboxylase gamma subunit
VVICLNGVVTEGLSVTVIGMGIVFAVLILLWGVLELMRVFFYKPNTKAKTVSENDQQEQQTFAFIEEREKIEEREREELIAVLTAAVAASLNQSTYNLQIKSLRRVENVTPVWNAVGRREQLETRL